MTSKCGAGTPIPAERFFSIVAPVAFVVMAVLVLVCSESRAVLPDE